MRNYFKKFSIMFVMTFAIIGTGLIYGENGANAATVGQQLTQPEAGWQRIDDTDSRIYYNDSVGHWTNSAAFNGTDSYVPANTDLNVKSGKIKIKFYGTKIRIITTTANNIKYDSNTAVSIDGQNAGRINLTKSSGDFYYSTLSYEKAELDLGEHILELTTSTGKYFHLDAIDIDSTGYLRYIDEAISLDKSTLNLTEGGLGQLTATTTPSAIGITWTTSNPSIATVDSTGKVTGMKEGTCTITATTADGLTATCTVTVTKKEDTQPTQTTGDANLFIELVDGQIKQYTVSQDEINKFTSWFENRDKDHSLTATYKFTRGTYKDYVVHDQIDWFEVR